MGFPWLAWIAIALAPETAAAQSDGPDGADIYMQHRCFVCHGELGEGGVGPRFSGDPMLTIEDYVIAQILIGREEMPAFADELSDQKIATVAEYIRNSWGNRFGPVSPQTVGEIRKRMEEAAQQTARARQSLRQVAGHER